MSDKKVVTSRERAIQCAALALDKKALDVKIFEISRHSSIADYLVLANGRSDKQAQAIADSVKQGMKKSARPLDIEGMQDGRWVIIDYGDVIVHVFQEEVRRHYDLDDLWRNCPLVEVPAEYHWEDKEQ